MSRTVLLADDHPLFRDALRLSVTQAMPGATVLEADSVESLFVQLEQHPGLELLLLDLSMPGAHGFSALIQARTHYPSLPIIVVSGQEDAHVVSRTLAHGAAAYVPKSAASGAIAEALRTVLQGGIWVPSAAPKTQASPRTVLAPDERDAARRIATLTAQQFRVLSMLLAGLINKQIAAELDVSEATVKAHMTAILQKLGVSNRTQAVLLAQRLAVDQADSSAALS